LKLTDRGGGILEDKETDRKLDQIANLHHEGEKEFFFH
jgi:hypothetical protein